MIHIEEGTALALVAAERNKQVLRGWGPEGDDKLTDGQLVNAAIAHAAYGLSLVFGGPKKRWSGLILGDFAEKQWPFKQRRWNEAGGWFPPDSPVENYVKAAAFLLAEIDRLLRLKNSPQ